MKTFLYLLLFLSILPASAQAAKSNPLWTIAKEPVTMMDLGIIKLNAALGRQTRPELRGATLGATFNARKGVIDIKVSMAVKKASKAQCKKIVNNAKKIFVQKYGKKKTSNIHHFFQHEGTGYSKRINWDSVAKHVVINGIALTKRNFQHSVYCKSGLMSNKVTY